jgi:hypothetical protein
MVINLGAALGAAAQSGVNTYLKLGEEQRQEEELNMRRQEAKYQEEQRQQERKLNELTSQTLGMGDTRVTGQDYTGVTGGTDTAEPALKTEAYTQQQKMADFKQRALSAGIPLQKVTAVSGAHRAEKYAEREELALGFTQQVMDDIKANPTDLGAVFKKHFQDQYNEGKLPGLSDGKTADVVPMEGRTGGQAIVIKDGKGNTTKTIPLTVDTIQAMTQKWAGAMMASSSPTSWWKSREEDLKSREVGLKEKLLPSEIAKNMATTNQANAHASVYGNMLQTAKDNKEAGKAMQPFLDEFAQMTPEEQAGSKGQAVLLKGATAGAQKSKDLAGIVTMLRKPDNAAVDPEMKKQAYTDLREAGNDATAQEAVRAKWPEVFGEDPALKAIRTAYSNKKDGTKVEQKGKKGQSSALPVPTDKDDLPVPSAPRAARAPYAAIDARGILRTPSLSAGMTTFNPRYDD